MFGHGATFAPRGEASAFIPPGRPISYLMEEDPPFLQPCKLKLLFRIGAPPPELP